MSRKDGGCDLTTRELPALFSEPGWAAKFPPILTLDQAAELVQVPKQSRKIGARPSIVSLEKAGPPATRTGTSEGNAVKTRRSSLSQESLVQFPVTAHPLEMCLDGYGPSRLLRTTGLSSTPQASSYRRGP